MQTGIATLRQTNFLHAQAFDTGSLKGIKTNDQLKQAKIDAFNSASSAPLNAAQLGVLQSIAGIETVGDLLGADLSKIQSAVATEPNGFAVLAFCAAAKAHCSSGGAAKKAFFEPPRAQQLPGASIDSANVDPTKCYRVTSLPISAYAAAGVDPALIEILQQADARGSETGAANRKPGHVTVAELLCLEEGGLLPDECARLPEIWGLMQVAPLMKPKGNEAPTALSELISDISVLPREGNVDDVAICIADLPKDMQRLAQRAHLVHEQIGCNRSCATTPTHVSVADLKFAANDPKAVKLTTPQQRTTIGGELCKIVQDMALVSLKAPMKAELSVATPGIETVDLADCGAAKFAMVYETRYKGEHAPTGRRRRESVPQHTFTAQRTAQLTVSVPEGMTAMLVKAGTDAERAVQSLGSGPNQKVDVPGGDYRVVLLENGKPIEQSSLQVPSTETQNVNLSAFAGFQLTAGAIPLELKVTQKEKRYNNATYSSEFVLAETTCGDGPSDATIANLKLLNGYGVGTNKLSPGRYAANIDGMPVKLDVFPNGAMRAYITDQKGTEHGPLRLTPGAVRYKNTGARVRPFEAEVHLDYDKQSNRYSGHTTYDNHTYLRFYPETCKLGFVQDYSWTHEFNCRSQRVDQDRDLGAVDLDPVKNKIADAC